MSLGAICTPMMHHVVRKGDRAENPSVKLRLGPHDISRASSAASKQGETKDGRIPGTDDVSPSLRQLECALPRLRLDSHVVRFGSQRTTFPGCDQSRHGLSV